MAKHSAVRTTRRRLHAVDSSPLSGVGAGDLDEHLERLASLLEARATRAATTGRKYCG